MSRSNPSKIIKADDYNWHDVERKEYKTDGSTFREVHRYALLGEREDEQQLNMQTRYFEVQPGGYTSLEYHRHPHSVVIIRGSGQLILGNELHDLGLHDVIYIAPDTLHQFQAINDEPLGFICIVDRYRDRPTLPDEEHLEREIRSEEVRRELRR